MPQHTFRATTVAFFACCNIVAVPLIIASGVVTASTWRTTLVAIPAVFAGTAIGSRIAPRSAPSGSRAWCSACSPWPASVPSPRSSSDPARTLDPPHGSRDRRGQRMSGWNFAEVWETVAELIPDAPAQVQGERRYTWREFDERANGIADTLLQAGCGRAGQGRPLPLQRPRVPRVDVRDLEGRAARRSTRTTATPTTSSSTCGTTRDAVAVVFHGSFDPTIERIRDRVDRVRLWLWVDDGAGPCPAWAVPYEQAATSHPDPGRSRRGAAAATTSTCSTRAAPRACRRA